MGERQAVKGGSGHEHAINLEEQDEMRWKYNGARDIEGRSAVSVLYTWRHGSNIRWRDNAEQETML